MVHKKVQLLKVVSIALLLTPYILYISFVIQVDRGPVDYETFMKIGHCFRVGCEVYQENSYYPLPFVMIFALFSWLPRPLSMTIWLLAPVIIALLITGGNPFILVFAPLFGHFVGGQTAVFGMLGLWGYRKNMEPNNAIGGIFLGLMLLKPQLGLIPLFFAMIQWWKQFRVQKFIPKQAWAWVLTTLFLFVPGFFFMPDWPLQWLSNPRPFFRRAMAGFLPRTLLYVVPPQTITYWVILIVAGILLLWGVFVLNNKQITLDLAVIWGFIVSPLVHDYDLIQLIPLLEKPTAQVAAILLSIPGWLVILFAYSNDAAWFAFTIIAPGILCMLLYQRRKLLRLSKDIVK